MKPPNRPKPTQGRSPHCQIVMITGTDTGAGKTLLTALLLIHLRRSGCHALAVKPFCSGGTEDAQILSRAQGGELSLAEISPWQFREPLAPLLAACREKRVIQIEPVLAHIRSIAARCDWLLVEGAGGLLVPLGRDFTAADLIADLHCAVVVAARNRLGVVNHALLTLEALRTRRLGPVTIALMDEAALTLAAKTNRPLLAEMAAPCPVLQVPYLGSKASFPGSLERSQKKIKKTLAEILRKDMLCASSTAVRRKE